MEFFFLKLVTWQKQWKKPTPFSYVEYGGYVSYFTKTYHSNDNNCSISVTSGQSTTAPENWWGHVYNPTFFIYIYQGKVH